MLHVVPPCFVMPLFQNYDFKVDVWSVGCVFVEMLSGLAPFRGNSDIHQLILIFNALGTPSETLHPMLTTLPEFHWTFPSWHEVGGVLSQLVGQLVSQPVRYLVS